jgi:hypothetical protein
MCERMLSCQLAKLKASSGGRGHTRQGVAFGGASRRHSL